MCDATETDSQQAIRPFTGSALNTRANLGSRVKEMCDSARN